MSDFVLEPLPVVEALDRFERISMLDIERDQWLDLRRNGIGGSDVGALVGVSRFRSAFEVWLDKTGRLEDADLSDNDAVHFGTVFEGAVADRFEHRTGVTVFNPKAMFIDPERPWRRVNPDRLLYEGGRLGVLEVKTASAFLWDDWANDQIPDAYELQAVYYAAVLGLPYAYVVALIGGQKLVWRRVEVDDEYAADVLVKVDDWWHAHVEADVAPEADASESCTDVLARLWKAQDGIVEVDDAALSWAVAYDDARRAEKQAEELKKLAGNRLRQIIGEKTEAHRAGRKVASWKPSERRQFDMKKFAAEHPDLVERYTASTMVRSLYVPKNITKEITP